MTEPMMPLRDCGSDPIVAAEPQGNYFVAVYPPFSCWTESATDQALQVLRIPQAATDQVPLGLYVHIPFCDQRCHFCYYRSYAQPPADRVNEYLAGLYREADLYRDLPRVAGRSLRFAYFGGGTPSLLDDQQIRAMFGRLKECWTWDDAAEVTFECAPRSVTADKLSLLREHGVTRISCGVQQLDDRVLNANGRIHGVDDVYRAYDLIRQAEFPVVNLDLMVGMVDETEETFFRSLESMIALRPDSVTLYQMEVPANTVLAKAVRQQAELRLPGWECKRRRLAAAFASLEQAGYTIQTAYAAIRDPSRHVFHYQIALYGGADLVGIGEASFSYVGGVHYQNGRVRRDYLDPLADGRLPIERAYRLSVDEQCVRELVLRLKLGRVCLARLQQKYAICLGERFAEPLQRLADLGWLEVDGDQLRLTPLGRPRVDQFLELFYLPQHQAASYW